MTKAQKEESNRKFLESYYPYRMLYYTDFDYSVLQMIDSIGVNRQSMKNAYANCFIMLDTETSKAAPNRVWTKTYKSGKTEQITDPVQNYIVAWSIAIRAFHHNITTLYGAKPSECIDCLQRIRDSINAPDLYVFVHNLNYDETFLRKFLFKAFGVPVMQLNTKPHYPISIRFGNGLILRDTLILSQRRLEKWAADLGVEHQKAVGKWDYEAIRCQGDTFTADNLQYIECDVLAGVECLNATADHLHKRVGSLPLTATGVPREQLRRRALPLNAHELYLSMVPSFDEQGNLESTYHGGFTHGNRFIIADLINRQYIESIGYDFDFIIALDFTSSYPFHMLACKYPMEKFCEMDDMQPDQILEASEEYAFYFEFIGKGIRLKDYRFPMPALQFSKCVKSVNAGIDNGRIIDADLVCIWLTEQDLIVIDKYYTWDTAECINVHAAHKEYLPDWFRNYVFECFENKCMLKNGDPVAYSISKSIANCLYGMCVQKPCKPDIQEDYATGNYIVNEEEDLHEKYEQHIQKKSSILPYQWGVWCTAYAFRSLFQLGECVKPADQGGIWLYSDTDSCYAHAWDWHKVEYFNENRKQMLLAAGYSAVIANGKEYWLGTASIDGKYTEFKTMGSKRYAVRDAETGKLKITVAGVPKHGAVCLDDDIANFRPGLIFDGKTTGKLTHTYVYADDIFTDENGNECADYVDLTECDYLLDCVQKYDISEYDSEEIEVQVYDEN